MIKTNLVLIEKDVLEAMQRIETADLKKLTIDEIEAYLTPLFTGYRATAPRFNKGLHIYRGRKCAKPISLKEVIYPLPSSIRRLGRANDIGESLFYAANGRSVPFFELDCKPGDLIALTKWKTNKKAIVNHIGYSPEIASQLGSGRSLGDLYDFIISTRSYSSLNSKVHDYLALKFSKKISGNSQHSYKLTVAIARKLFKNNMFDGLLYPTMAMSGNGDNIVFKCDYVDKHLEFLSIEYIKIKYKSGMIYDFEILDSSTIVDKKGNFVWSGRPLQNILKEKGQKLTMVSENGEWVAYDTDGNRVYLE